MISDYSGLDAFIEWLCSHIALYKYVVWSMHLLVLKDYTQIIAHIGKSSFNLMGHIIHICNTSFSLYRGEKNILLIYYVVFIILLCTVSLSVLKGAFR